MKLLWRGLIYAFVGLVVMTLAVQLWFLGSILVYKKFSPDSTAFMRQRLAVLRIDNPRAAIQYQWVDYEKISTHLKRALVAAEDSKYVDHEGFDWDGIQLAREKNELAGKQVAGGSTITQQLAKNLFLYPDKTYLRKGQEAVITLMLEQLLDKERILELYLNVIEWGEGLFGAEAAAQHYFKTSAARLTPSQAARLAAMAPNPRYYQKYPNAPGLKRKSQIVLRQMGHAELPE
jgi:monofunctional glycosyltransferase